MSEVNTKKYESKKDKDKDDQTSVTDAEGSHTIDEDNEHDLLHEVMGDNLDLMLEIIMKVREDEEFAKTIYEDCPRLQHLLDQHPDLRPVFEDPNLVRISFEQVYRKAGGVLPEDKPGIFRRTLACIVTHPLFKVFRFLLLIKKLVNCVFGGGFSVLKSCLLGLFAEEAVEMAGEAATEGDLSPDDMDGGNPENIASKEALSAAADHMEEPEVQEQMQKILESDPDDLDEAIENDPELRALRESNPLCAELMNDPATMKILVEPDNLRALGECPDLIEADYADPDWSPPDVEIGTFDDAAVGDATSAGAEEFFDAEGEGDGEGDGDGDEDGDEEEEEEEEEGFMDEFERGDETEGKAANKKQNNKKQQKKGQDGKEGGGGGFLSTIGTGLVDYIAAETVGMTTSEMMGGDDDFGADAIDDKADEAAEEAASKAEQAADKVESAAESAAAVGEMALNEDMAENLENTMDNVEEAHDSKNVDQQDSTGNKAATIAEGAAVGGVAVVGGTSKAAGVGDSDHEEEGEEEDGKKKKKKRGFRGIGGAIGGAAAALGTAAKEMVATAVLGDDLGEDFVERMEESDEEEDDDDDDKDKQNEKKEGGDKDDKKKAKGRLSFRKNK